MKRHITDDTSLSLIVRVRRMEPAAWDRLVDLYGPLVFHWCSRRGVREEDAGDVVQEVFSAVAKGIGSFDHGQPGSTFRGWLRVIARNQIALFFRKASVRPVAQGGDAATRRIQAYQDQLQADQDDEEQEKASLFMRSLEMIRAEFGSGTWQAFWMIVVEQKDAESVAESLQMGRGAVRQAKYRVLKRLREEFGDVLD